MQIKLRVVVYSYTTMDLWLQNKKAKINWVTFNFNINNLKVWNKRMSGEQRWKPSDDVKATFEAILDSFCLKIMKRKATSTKWSTQNTSVCARGSGAVIVLSCG